MVWRASGSGSGCLRAGLLSVARATALASTAAAPASAETGLEQAVGPIPAATAALLPADSQLWGAYTLADTPDLCKAGSIKCVDDTIARMFRRFDPFYTSSRDAADAQNIPRNNHCRVHRGTAARSAP